MLNKNRFLYSFLFSCIKGIIYKNDENLETSFHLNFARLPLGWNLRYSCKYYIAKRLVKLLFTNLPFVRIIWKILNKMTRFPTTKTCIVGNEAFTEMRLSTKWTFSSNFWRVLKSILLGGVKGGFSFPGLVELHCLASILFQRCFHFSTFLNVFFYSFSKYNQILVVLNSRSSQTLSNFEIQPFAKLPTNFDELV